MLGDRASSVMLGDRLCSVSDGDRAYSVRLTIAMPANSPAVMPGQ